MKQLYTAIASGLFLLGAVAHVYAAPEATVNARDLEPARELPIKQVKGDLKAAEQAWTLIKDGALVIDVRHPGEFSEGHLEGAINIEYTDTAALAAAIGEDRGRPVVLYCGSGRRAGLAIQSLEEHGYSGIFNASGFEALLETRPDPGAH